MKLLQNRRSRAKIFVALLVCILAVIFIAVKDRKQPSVETLQAGGRKFSLEVARTPQAQALGLGNRASMPTDHGMLFVFAKPAVECFWMKDMHFPLDMIWTDQHKKVIYIKQNVSPNSYPETFCPDAPAKYVIELNAGTAASAGIHGGGKLSF